MINDIEEDDCSLEVSWLLKDKGFAANCHKYKFSGGDNYMEDHIGHHHNDSAFPRRTYIPTHALAIKWIRLNFGFQITCGITSDKTGFSWVIYNIGKNKNADYLTFPQDTFTFNSPEEAADAALLYTIKNLIP